MIPWCYVLISSHYFTIEPPYTIISHFIYKIQKFYSFFSLDIRRKIECPEKTSARKLLNMAYFLPSQIISRQFFFVKLIEFQRFSWPMKRFLRLDTPRGLGSSFLTKASYIYSRGCLSVCFFGGRAVESIYPWSLRKNKSFLEPEPRGAVLFCWSQSRNN